MSRPALGVFGRLGLAMTTGLLVASALAPAASAAAPLSVSWIDGDNDDLSTQDASDNVNWFFPDGNKDGRLSVALGRTEVVRSITVISDRGVGTWDSIFANGTWAIKVTSLDGSTSYSSSQATINGLAGPQTVRVSVSDNAGTGHNYLVSGVKLLVKVCWDNGRCSRDSVVIP